MIEEMKDYLEDLTKRLHTPSKRSGVEQAYILVLKERRIFKRMIRNLERIDKN